MKTSINIWTANNVLSFQSLFSWLCKIWEGIQHEQPSVQGQAGHSLQQPPSLRRLQDDPHLRGGGVEYPRRAAFTVTSLSLRIRWHNRCKDVGSSRILRQFISLVSAFLWISALCVMKRNLRIKKKLHPKNRRSESKCKDCGRQQKDSRDRCSTEHRLWQFPGV